MIHSSARRLLTLLLAVLVTVSLNLSAVQAGGMALEMANVTPMSGMTSSMSGMDSSVSGDCQKCSSNDDHAAMVAVCGTVCVAPATATLPQDSPAILVLARLDFVKHHSLLHGRASPPDPYPPRPGNIG